MKIQQTNAEKLLVQFLKNFYPDCSERMVIPIHQIQSYFTDILLTKILLHDKVVTLAVHCNRNWVHFIPLDEAPGAVGRTSDIRVVIAVKIGRNKIIDIQVHPYKGSTIKTFRLSKSFHAVLLSLHTFFSKIESK